MAGCMVGMLSMPAALAVMVARALMADMADKQALGARADLFAAHNSKQAHDVAAAVAAVSVFPHRSSAATSGPLLAGADGKPISAWGKVTKKLNFGLHTFIVSFILAAVSKPILGIDFLSAHRLLVDPFSKAVAIYLQRPIIIISTLKRHNYKEIIHLNETSSEGVDILSSQIRGGEV